MNKSESIKELAAALSKVQSQIGLAKKTSENPFFHSSYADFSSIWETCRKSLTDNGLSVSQLPISEDNKVGVETILMHNSGEWISTKLLLTPVKTDPQAQGSAITYARRYSLSGIVCLATEEDDDGNKATEGKKENGKKEETSKNLSCTELCTRISEAKALPELDNIAKKYKADYDFMTPEEQVKVRTNRDKKASQLKEQLKAKEEAI